MEELIKAGWLRTTHRDLPCAAKTYTWLGVYGDFRIYADRSGAVDITVDKRLVATFSITINDLSFFDLEKSCKLIIQKGYKKYIDA